MATPVYFDIGDYVWLDSNANGVQDNGEQGIKDVKVYLCDKDGTPILNRQNQETIAITDANGFYKFTQVDNGEYTLRFVDPSNTRIFTYANSQSNDEKDSDADPKTGLSHVFTINYNTDLSIDAGLYLKSNSVSLGDYVWEDKDKDGIQDTDESGIEGVTVKLYYSNGTLLDETQTDQHGKYLFDELLPGQYKVQFVLPNGYEFSPQHQGGTASDSDADPDDGLSHEVDLTAPQSSDRTIDAGLVRTTKEGEGSIGDRLWLDRNHNGIQDSGEAGVGGVTVTLTSGNETRTTTTSTVAGREGEYLFDKLPAGNYTVKFGVPSSYRFTHANLGGDESKDSDVSNVGEASLTLADKQHYSDLDAGVYNGPLSGMLGNFVWDDKDGDGVQDTDGTNPETGIAGVTVELYNGNKQYLMSTTTDNRGIYGFDELLPGDYFVKFPSRTGATFSPKDNTSNDEKDSDANSNGWTDKYTLLPGQKDYSIDAGYSSKTTGDLGDYVWHDKNLNGLQDADEQGIQGAVVRLYDKDKKFTGRQAFTDETGHYLFKDVTAGDYHLWISAVDDAYAGTDKDKGDDLKDSDIDAKTWWTDKFTVVAGQQDLSRDAGFYKTASIGDKVWKDADNDGLQDKSGEAGLRGLKVELYDQTGTTRLAETTTGAKGDYLFEGLRPGSYKVKFYAKDGYAFTQKDAGDNTLDSDANVATGFTDIVVVAEGEYNSTIDAGMDVKNANKKATVGNFVWHDLNANGLQDEGEKGVSGAKIQLTDKNGNVLSSYGTKTSSSSGAYSFTNVAAGEYRLKFTAPSGYQTSKANQGPNGSDSDPDPVTGLTEVFTLTEGQVDYSWDMGVYKLSSIGDYVWEDSNRNGIQNSGEKGIGGAKVELYAANNLTTPLKTTTTTTVASTGNPIGKYQFTDLAPGEYKVKFYKPEVSGSEYRASPQAEGSSRNLDSDAAVDTGWSDVIVLPSNTDLSNIDAGFYKHDANTIEIGDRVWHDVDGDGIQDKNTDGSFSEAGIKNVTVKLFKQGSNTAVATTKTDDDGNYRFTEIAAGEYRVQFVKPSGYVTTTTEAGTDRTLDSNRLDASGYTAYKTYAAGAVDRSIDVGYVKPAAIGNKVWNDNEQNGISTGDSGINGVTVELYRASNLTTPIATDVTAGGGGYNFTNLTPGEYRVKFGTKNGMLFTSQNVGNDEAIDSDADVNGWSDVITLKEGETNNDVDAGLYAPLAAGAAIGDRVWHDKDGDGQQHKNTTTEPGINNVTVALYKASDLNTVFKTTTTNSSGIYKFEGLELGDYKVKFSNLPAGYSFTQANQGGDGSDSDANQSSGWSDLISLTRAGEYNKTIDAGAYKPISIGDYVWLDQDGNGQQGSSTTEKAGVAGVKVTLYSAEGVVKGQTETDNTGKYGFNNLAPGKYKLHFGLPEKHGFTLQDIGNDKSDSDVDPKTGYTEVFTLTSGQADNLTLDAGISKLGSIGDRVWHDIVQTGANGVNGIQDANEVGLARVEVELWRKEGTKYEYTGLKTETDDYGNYLFHDLPAGSYGVKFIAPTGYIFTYANIAGSNETNDSDANRSTGFAYLDLASGEDNRTVDAGLTKGATIGNWVWNDHGYDGYQTPNGIQDAVEGGVHGHTVYLQNSAGQNLGSTTTAGGGYSFTNLLPGTYRIYTPVATGTADDGTTIYGQYAPANRGNDDTKDSDAVGGYTAFTTLSEGEVDLTWDVGLTPLALDLNGNGIQTLARDQHSPTFDLLGNGQAIRSGWLSGDDGFLAIDNNSNGQIDNINELFGGLNKGDGFAKLVSFDSNGDGLVDANDTRFAELRIWQDANGNRVTDAGELVNLSEHHISSLNVNFVEVPEVDAQGNLHLERSNATLSDGSRIDMTDVYFNVAHSDAAAAGVLLPSFADLLSDSASLDGLLGGSSDVVGPVFSPADPMPQISLAQYLRVEEIL